MDNLTGGQKAVLIELITFIRVHGKSPTFEELQLRLGYASKNAVECHLKPLEKKGYITRDRKQSRSIRVAGFCPACGRPAEEPSDLKSPEQKCLEK